MPLSTRLNKAADPSADAGFVPCESEDAVAHQLLRPLFADERETVLLAGFDAFERLVRLERIDSDANGRCNIQPLGWRAMLATGIATVVMAHNHPSGDARPSGQDRRTTQEAALFLRILGIDLADHLIFVAGGHFSFRRAQMI